MELEEYYRVFIKYCPECGKELEQHPISRNYACFLHGDFYMHPNGVIGWHRTRHLINREESSNAIESDNRSGSGLGGNARANNER